MKAKYISPRMRNSLQQYVSLRESLIRERSELQQRLNDISQALGGEIPVPFVKPMGEIPSPSKSMGGEVPVPFRKGRRRMSVAGRAKIAAAARARWAKAKKAGRNRL